MPKTKNTNELEIPQNRPGFIESQRQLAENLANGRRVDHENVFSRLGIERPARTVLGAAARFGEGILANQAVKSVANSLGFSLQGFTGLGATAAVTGAIAGGLYLLRGKKEKKD